ncbi:hypothetical protein JAAARDRAFT_203636 [Jaapia argillacea MUCL 33604]|uniref:Small ribosomal subunit protein mS41 n=1 Tax=Jaapia argillacea MUCL 33604 TaxID=933084 RepID=A0A067Q6E4_9AGAM|nr:hypothetical protein JAAARDRAFT_203636 [Jaapia argillacea MUCL 33604]
MSHWLAARLRSFSPSFTRCLQTFAGQPRRLPQPPSRRDDIRTPQAFLKAIGRQADTMLSPKRWKELWDTRGPDLKEKGLSVKDRRYILWCMHKYRNGLMPDEFAHKPKPKKKVRGWGPAVQNGKRIRSRRIK